MASFNKFQDFVEQLGKGVHQLHSGGHTLKVYLSNTAPSASLHAVKADLAEIAMTNEANHGAGGGDIQNDFTEAGGVGTLTGVDVVFQATGGPVGPFRYVVLYNDTPVGDNLIGWWDYGSSITLNDGESFTVNFGASILTVE